MLTSRACGLAAGLMADALLGDPEHHHPVAWFGSWAHWLEQRMHADDTVRGTLYLAAVLAPLAGASIALELNSRRHPLTHAAVTALCTWAVVGAHSLSREGTLMAERLDLDDLDGARARLGNLCGRDPSGLDHEELARAAVESMAENTADAVVASLWWGALGGIPGLVLHRGINTLDAMVGHRTQRFAHFGTASARMDDLAALAPARITGLAACLLAPYVGGSTRESWRIMRRDARRHPSPNGGWCEAAWAGALGVQLGGRNVYARRTETRPLLGEGPRPRSPELRRAAALVGAVTASATAVAVLGLLATARLGTGRDRP
ncbi:cobalamin biosynthesis protein [Tessaracoccus antarcticus]|nr:cobalamin biosynthesis protein [Tessaracoccus antarcticus]